MSQHDRTLLQQLEQIDGLIELGRYREAIQGAGQILAEDPSHCGAHCRRALAHLNLKEYPQALESANHARSLNPDDEWAHRLASTILLSMGRHRVARLAAQECVRCAPHSPQALFTLANALIESGMLQEARPVLQQLMNVAPEWSGSWELTAILAYRARNTAEAVKHAQRLLQLDPNSATARNILGSVALQHGHNDDALHHFIDAARTNPLSKVSHRNIAVAANKHDNIYRTHAALFVGLIVASFLWSRIPSVPPLLTLLASFVYGALAMRTMRFVIQRTLPPENRALVDLEPQLYYRYTRWIVQTTLYGLVCEMILATNSGGYLSTLPYATLRTLKTVTGMLTMLTLIVAVLSRKGTPLDRWIARFVASRR